ncbi:MAG: hypothetical protein V9E98_14900 [Candidatus Nanopelagicales bacterium]
MSVDDLAPVTADPSSPQSLGQSLFEAYQGWQFEGMEERSYRDPYGNPVSQAEGWCAGADSTDTGWLTSVQEVVALGYIRSPRYLSHQEISAAFRYFWEANDAWCRANGYEPGHRWASE